MEKIQTQGVAIPRLGFGTFRMPGGGCQPVVESALGLGFRHIDTAAMYENEDAVGAAIASSGVKREDLFVTTKVARPVGTRRRPQGVRYQPFEAEARLRRHVHGPLA